MGSPDALNRGAKEGKGKGTSQPGHGAATYKIIACIERATVLRANITHVTCEYKAGEGVPSYSQFRS